MHLQEKVGDPTGNTESIEAISRCEGLACCGRSGGPVVKGRLQHSSPPSTKRKGRKRTWRKIGYDS